MNCPQCRSTNAQQSKFCSQCGFRFTPVPDDTTVGASMETPPEDGLSGSGWRPMGNHSDTPISSPSNDASDTQPKYSVTPSNQAPSGFSPAIQSGGIGVSPSLLIQLGARLGVLLCVGLYLLVGLYMFHNFRAVPRNQNSQAVPRNQNSQAVPRNQNSQAVPRNFNVHNSRTVPRDFSLLEAGLAVAASLCILIPCVQVSTHFRKSSGRSPLLKKLAGLGCLLLIGFDLRLISWLTTFPMNIWLIIFALLIGVTLLVLFTLWGVVTGAAGMGNIEEFIEGQVHNFRSEFQPQRNKQSLVITFVIERHNQAQRLPPVPVVMRGKQLDGVISENDWVRVGASQPRKGGVIYANRLINLTTQSSVIISDVFWRS